MQAAHGFSFGSLSKSEKFAKMGTSITTVRFVLQLTKQELTNRGQENPIESTAGRNRFGQLLSVIAVSLPLETTLLT
jgi:hypothetical protein